MARSLKITRATHTLVAAVTAAAALNAMVAMQFIGTLAQVCLLAVLFVSIAIGSVAVSADVYTRASQTVANLRSIGASRRSVSSAFAFATIGYGVGGAAAGTFAGAALGLAFGGAGSASTLSEALGVVVAASAATAAGFYGGVRVAWRS